MKRIHLLVFAIMAAAIVACSSPKSRTKGAALKAWHANASAITKGEPKDLYLSDSLVVLGNATNTGDSIFITYWLGIDSAFYIFTQGNPVKFAEQAYSEALMSETAKNDTPQKANKTLRQNILLYAVVNQYFHKSGQSTRSDADSYNDEATTDTCIDYFRQ